jgi:predicted ATPase
MEPSDHVALLAIEPVSSDGPWERVPSAETVPVDRYDDVVSEAVRREGGSVFGGSGGRKSASFSVGAAAARAAIDIQRSLVQTESDSPAVRVRMALHACVDGRDQHGDTVARRVGHLASIAYGGQILASGAMCQLLREGGSAFELTDLGTHRLKDLSSPEHVFQLVVQGLRSDYPPLKSLGHPDLQNNLPSMLSSFVGRNEELDVVLGLVERSRLVTLTGAGGAGKTRLALQAAAESLDPSGDGAWLVELAAIRDEQLVPAAIVSALGIPNSEINAFDFLVRSLSMQQPLLLLDNCEHIVEPVATVVDALLRNCPGVRVLATSREPLGVEGELVYRVPSMTLPREDVISLAEVGGSDAVDFFLAKASDAGALIADDDAPLVTSVCRRLDGIPLALELAAARLRSLSLAELSDHLDKRFQLLIGGSRSAMARQQTLQALVDWSYDLLHPAERSVLQQLSAFSGSFDLSAAEAVCSDGSIGEIDVLNLVHSLVEKSLVIAHQEECGTRFHLLETIRQYAAIELLRDTGEIGVLDVRDRHADHFMDIARRVAPELLGMNVGATIRSLDREGDNLRTAISHLVQDRPSEVLELVSNLERYISLNGALEVLPPTLEAVSKVDQSESTNAQLAANALIAVAVTLGWHRLGQLDELKASLKYIERAEELAKRTRRLDLEARAHNCHANVLCYLGELKGADEHSRFAEELARRCRNDSVLSHVLVTALNRRLLEYRGLTTEQMCTRAEEAMRVAERAGDLTMISQVQFWIAGTALREGRFDEARRLYEQNLVLAHEIGAYDGFTLNNLLVTCLAQADFAAAMDPLRTCLRRMRRAGFHSNPGDLIAAAACIVTARGDFLAGAQLHGAANRIREPAYASGELTKTSGEEDIELASSQRSRTAIGDEEYLKAYKQGAAMPAGDACELALATLGQ